MIRLQLPAALVATIILFIVTVWLAKLNWNDEIEGRVFAIFVGGVITVFIAIYTTKVSLPEKCAVVAGAELGHARR
jgi:hypothetical protein